MPKYVLIGLIVVIGTFLIMNYWPKLKEQTKNRILMVIGKYYERYYNGCKKT